MAEEEGFGGLVEGGDEEVHQYGNFDAGIIDADLLEIFFIAAGEEFVEQVAIERLIDDAGDADDDERSGVAEHLAPELAVEAPVHAEILGDKE